MYRHPPDSSHALRYIGMKFAAIINPEVRKPAPKPVRVDLRKTFLIGCVLWSVALIVAIVRPWKALEKVMRLCFSGLPLAK